MWIFFYKIRKTYFYTNITFPSLFFKNSTKQQVFLYCFHWPYSPTLPANQTCSLSAASGFGLILIIILLLTNFIKNNVWKIIYCFEWSGSKIYTFIMTKSGSDMDKLGGQLDRLLHKFESLHPDTIEITGQITSALVMPSLVLLAWILS